MVRGDYNDPLAAGEVSHFQALSTALSGTVGLGNIAGVAVAVSLGGPGATFWMILAGFLGMSSKFTECTLGVKYRQTNADGSVSGKPEKLIVPLQWRIKSKQEIQADKELLKQNPIGLEIISYDLLKDVS